MGTAGQQFSLNKGSFVTSQQDMTECKYSHFVLDVFAELQGNCDQYLTQKWSVKSQGRHYLQSLKSLI